MRNALTTVQFLQTLPNGGGIKLLRKLMHGSLFWQTVDNI